MAPGSGSEDSPKIPLPRGTVRYRWHKAFRRLFPYSAPPPRRYYVKFESALVLPGLVVTGERAERGPAVALEGGPMHQCDRPGLERCQAMQGRRGQASLSSAITLFTASLTSGNSALWP